MIGFLAAPAARWAALAGLLAVLAGWAWLERAGRQVATLEAARARREVAGLRQTIEQMGVRREAEDNAARDPDPAASLRDRWGRP